MGENTFTSYLTQQLGVKGDPIKRGKNKFTSSLTQQQGGKNISPLIWPNK